MFRLNTREKIPMKLIIFSFYWYFVIFKMSTLGIIIEPNRVYRLMQELGIRSVMNHCFKKPGTHVEYSQRPNLV